MAWYEKYAAYHGYDINEENEKKIAKVLSFNKKYNGKMYCPKKPHLDDNVCPCKDLRENYKCDCDFFIKKEE